jgi:plastocyanin
MDTQDGHGAAHGAPFERRLPSPSPWPIIAAIAALLLAFSLIWASNQDNDDITVPIVAGCAAFLVATAVGWAAAEGPFANRMRAERAGAEVVARKTQVLTFAVAEGQLEAAKADGGVIAALEASVAGLRAHAGFQDFRLTVSPESGGPTNVFVETTWADSSALAGYDAGRGALLDIVAAAGDQVVAGSVQAFDMDLVKETKDLAPRFSAVSALVAMGALVAGGLIAGVIATAADDGTASGGGGGDGGGAPADPYEVTATDNKFSTSSLKAPPATDVVFTLVNNGKIAHNLAFYQSKGGPELATGSVGEIITGGKTVDVEFTTPGTGSYYYQCDLHPTEMFGTFTVEDGAPPPGGAPATTEGGAGAAASPTAGH